ncbi:MAG: DUF6584 family protein [Mycobacteriales bacterium]
MPIDETLAKIEEDFAAGRAALARQRLKGLVGSFPERLDLREQLAALYRHEGDLAQAGRWSFLADAPIREELEAFESVHKVDLSGAMRALKWPGGEAAAPSAAASERLRVNGG